MPFHKLQLIAFPTLNVSTTRSDASLETTERTEKYKDISSVYSVVSSEASERVVNNHCKNSLLLQNNSAQCKSMRRLLLLTPLMLAAMPYEIEFIGLSDPAALKSMFDVSDLVILQERPPASLNGLRYRASNDIPALLQIMRAYGYYDAEITSQVTLKNHSALVSIYIEPGVQYLLSSYEVYHGDCSHIAQIPCCSPFSADNLGLKLDAPALSVDIVNAESTLLTRLAECGYPLASVEKRRVIVDMQSKQVEASACIAEGPLAKFGPLSVWGIDQVKPSWILGKVTWEEGETYSTDCVETTQKRLLNSGLFSSVMITHGQELDQKGELPMTLRLSEAKHKQISAGIFYATVDGPGINFSWTHRNLRGVGEVLSLSGEYSERYFEGLGTWKKNDVFGENQTIRVLAQVSQENIYPYHAFSYRAASFFDKKIDAARNFTAGLEVLNINVHHSANNGSDLLLSLPMIVSYNTAEDFFNPVRGYGITYQPQLFQSLSHQRRTFFKQRLTAICYLPLRTDKLILALRGQFGSIAGAPQDQIPIPLLFLGGSEEDLRGYRYRTVSPLDQNNKPYGGRSAIFLTSELRLRFSDLIGIVPFADFGTIAFSELPTVDTKWYKSVGIGLRIYTFFGPLRADVGFPLDRRSIDPYYRIYASIGQTF